MHKLKKCGITLAGICAGAVNGLFGAGGGMVLVPLLSSNADLQEQEVFPASVAIILPICLVSLTFSLDVKSFDWFATLPYIIGSAAGGVLSGFLGKAIPTLWLHRILGAFILWGGVRYLC